MLEVGGGGDFLDEPLGAEHGGEFRPQHLDRDLALVLEILGEVDRGHTARTDFPLDGVPVGEGGGETVEKVRHCVLAPLATGLRIRSWVLDGQPAKERAYALTTPE